MYASPEEAALEDFPASHCRIIASRVQGNAAYVLLDTGSRKHPYLYGVACAREADGWRGGTSGNGPGWTRVDSEAEQGILALWDVAPSGADRVRAEHNGQIVEAPIDQGVYLVVWWDVPSEDSRQWPVPAFRIDGEWIAATEIGKRPG
jgi:hypothetical protein